MMIGEKQAGGHEKPAAAANMPVKIRHDLDEANAFRNLIAFPQRLNGFEIAAADDRLADGLLVKAPGEFRISAVGEVRSCRKPVADAVGIFSFTPHFKERDDILYVAMHVFLAKAAPVVLGAKVVPMLIVILGKRECANDGLIR